MKNDWRNAWISHMQTVMHYVSYHLHKSCKINTQDKHHVVLLVVDTHMHRTCWEINVFS